MNNLINNSLNIPLINGRVLYVNKNIVWVAKGLQLLYSIDNGKTWKKGICLPIKSPLEYLSVFKLGRRLGRVGFHHMGKIRNNLMLIIANNHIFQFSTNNLTFERLHSFVGSRPLSICIAKKFVYYGEYRSNQERSNIHIWRGEIGNLMCWTPVWNFTNVRHVHGVFYDPYTSAIWVTTGDSDNESAIWVTYDEFKTLRKVVGGAQKYRAVQLLFTKKYIFYGSDAPSEKNYIYRLSRNGKNLKLLTSVGSSIFYGCKVDDKLFFSTAVEPSVINKTSYSEIWGTLDQVCWEKLFEFRKDIWPLRYFQYGQVIFPAGPGDDLNLWFTPMSTQNDDYTFKIPLKNIFQ